MRSGLIGGASATAALYALIAVTGCNERNPKFDEADGTSGDASGSWNPGSDDGAADDDGSTDGGSNTHPGSSATGSSAATGTGSTGGTTGSSGSVGGTSGTSGSSAGATTSDSTTTGLGTVTLTATNNSGGSTSGTTCGVACKAPIIHLPFDNDAKNVGSLGTAHNGVESNVSYVAGKIGPSAVVFRSDPGSKITIPATRAPLSNGFTYTIAFWFREDSIQNPAFFLLNFRVSPNGGGFHTYHGVSAPELFQCFSATPSGGGCENFPYTVGQWHHLLYRCEGTALTSPGGCDLEIFLDNQLVRTFSTSGSVIFSPQQALDMVLGEDTNFQLDDFKIFDTVFSDQLQCEHVIGGTWVAGSCALP